jgi:hypothetical protein
MVWTGDPFMLKHARCALCVTTMVTGRSIGFGPEVVNE